MGASGTDTTGDERRLWAAYGASELGSALATGALPLVALVVLDVASWQVSLLAAVGGLTSAVIAVPLGPVIEARRKRPAMIAADLVRAAALLSVPIAASRGVLTFAQLCFVSVLTTSGAVAFSAASTAHLAWLVPERRRVRILSRFESTQWFSATVGPPLGGAIIAVFGATSTLAVDAMSFVASALGVRSLKRPEPKCPRDPRDAAQPPTRDRLNAGWRIIRRHPGLSALFTNAMLFGGALMMAYPLQTVLMLRDLDFTPWQYGLALGLPALGGLVGAAMTPRLVRRFGERRVLLVAGAGRAVWLVPIAFAPAGGWGVVVIVLADAALLFGAGVFNPLFAAYRMRETPTGHLARVTTAWSIGSRVVQPAAMMLGAVLVAMMPIRAVIVVAGLLLATSGLFLPWRRA